MTPNPLGPSVPEAVADVPQHPSGQGPAWLWESAPGSDAAVSTLFYCN